MFLKKISLVNFRNYSQISIDFDKKINIFSINRLTKLILFSIMPLKGGGRSGAGNNQ